MTVHIDTPDTIPLAKVLAFLADLGLPGEDLREMTVGINGVQAEFVARNQDGHPYMDGDDIAVHVVSIPMDRNT